MGNTGRRILLGLVLLAVAVGAQAFPRPVNLQAYLQAELNEIAMLTAQQNYLLQQGNTVGAALVGSYIPDHQMQADLLAQVIRQRGGDPSEVRSTVTTPFVGTYEEIVNHDQRAHAMVADMYRELQRRATSREVNLLADNGLSGARRHLASLNVAAASLNGGPEDIAVALRNALQLERTAIVDLRTQAAQLRELGNPQLADQLLAVVPQHQAQADRLASLLRDFGTDPATVEPITVAALPTQDAILAHVRSLDIQMANTYAQPIAVLPPSPVRTATIEGQRTALIALAMLFGGPMPA